MTTLDHSMRIARAQQRLFRCIEDELRRDGHHKSYEGAIDVTMSLPNYFEQSAGVSWAIELHCYVVGDSRHETWSAATLVEAVAQMERWIDRTCAPYEMARFERDMNLNEDEPGEADGSVTIYGNGRNDA